jgi:hypothetical protein
MPKSPSLIPIDRRLPDPRIPHAILHREGV